MATLDLSLVTLSLKTLLHVNIRRLKDGVPATDVAVTLQPPEQVVPAVETVNIHLYHVSEDPHFKNQIGLVGAEPKVAGQPLALKLYYILTTHVPDTMADHEAKKQALFGLALKTLHDYPVINDGLQLAPSETGLRETIMDTDLRGGGNFIETCLRPLEPEESLNFWAAEDQKTPRLSAFYEVRTVLFTPEKPKTSSGPVLNVGIYVGSSAPAQILNSSTQMTVTPPSSLGLSPQTIELSPARTTLQESAVPGRVPIRINGHNMTTGDTQSLTLKKSDWDDPIIISSDLNPLWELALSHDHASFIMQDNLSHNPGGGVAAQAILPGFYEVGLLITNNRQLGTQIVSSSHSAGKTVIAVGAHIDGDAYLDTAADLSLPADPPGHALNAGDFPLIRIDVSPAVDTLESIDDVTLSVGGKYYNNMDAAFSAANTGEFRVHNHVVYFAPTFDPALSAAYPVQLIINGVQTQPYWLERP